MDGFTGVARNFDWEGPKMKIFYDIIVKRRNNDKVTEMTL